MRASDWLQYGAWTTGVTVIDAPVANRVANNTVTTNGHTFAATSLFTETDADGDTLTQYDFWDAGAAISSKRRSSREVGVSSSPMNSRARLAIEIGCSASTTEI